MRKKIVRLPRQTQILPRPIVTFDNKEHSQSLLEPLGRKYLTPDVLSKHAGILRASAAQAGTACLTNNQILQEQRMMALHRRPILHPTLQKSMLWISLQYNNPELYEVFTDPEMIAGEGLVQQQEQSISFPLITFTVRRYQAISVRFRGQTGREQRRLEGPLAWAFQQGLQQLDGTVLFDWRVCHGNVSFNQEAAPHFPRSSAVLEEYSKDLRKVFEEYPQLIKQQQKFEGELKVNELQEENLPFEHDYYRRLMKHYSRQMLLLQQRLQGGQNPRDLREPEGVDVRMIDK